MRLGLGFEVPDARKKKVMRRREVARRRRRRRGLGERSFPGRSLFQAFAMENERGDEGKFGVFPENL